MQRCILLCNSCVLSEGKLCSDNPDEVALLYGVRELGSVIVQKSDETVVLRVNGGEAEEWKLLRVNAFSSERKCMSVVAKNEKHGVIRVYVKVCVVEWTDVQGAEECVLAECDEKESEVSRMDSQQSYKLDNASEMELLRSTSRTCDKKGWYLEVRVTRRRRKLVLAMRSLAEEEWTTLNNNMTAAECSIHERESLVEQACCSGVGCHAVAPSRSRRV